MIKEIEKRTFKDCENCSTTLENAVYVIYDTELQYYCPPMCIPVSKLYDYFSLVVNDVSSQYFMNESKFHLYRVGSFDTITGIITNEIPTFVNSLDKYVDNSKRKLQTIIQVLNYLPCGYFKMPDEMKKVIQEKIDVAITEYVSTYVIPDLDVSKFDIGKVKDIYENYDLMLKSFDSLNINSN